MIKDQNYYKNKRRLNKLKLLRKNKNFNQNKNKSKHYKIKLENLSQN